MECDVSFYPSTILHLSAGYLGSTCEEKVDPCASAPCQNNGTCYADGLHFGCSCSAGFTGPACAQLVDFCALSPCAHGTCRSVGTSYKCLCDPGGYRGRAGKPSPSVSQFLTFLLHLSTGWPAAGVCLSIQVDPTCVCVYMCVCICVCVYVCVCSVASVVSDSLQPYGL